MTDDARVVAMRRTREELLDADSLLGERMDVSAREALRRGLEILNASLVGSAPVVSRQSEEALSAREWAETLHSMVRACRKYIENHPVRIADSPADTLLTNIDLALSVYAEHGIADDAPKMQFPTWIPVSTKPPRDPEPGWAKTVLLYFGDDEFDVGHYAPDDDCWMIHDCEGFYGEAFPEPTHWMPLPEAPGSVPEVPCLHEIVRQTIIDVQGLRIDTETRCVACGKLLKSTRPDNPSNVARQEDKP